jgi:hypothetical protein
LEVILQYSVDPEGGSMCLYITCFLLTVTILKNIVQAYSTDSVFLLIEMPGRFAKNCIEFSGPIFSFREYVVDLDVDSQHLMRYRSIAPLVSSGAVQLI